MKYKTQTNLEIQPEDIVWFLSDTHFGDESIIGFCNRPINCDEIIINNWKNIVGKNDTVILLGDFTFKPVNIHHLPGRSKILIKGNHDELHYNAYYDMGFDIVFDPYTNGPFVINYLEYNIALTHEPIIFHKYDLNIHGHLHNLAKLESVSKHYLVALEYTDYKPVLLSDIVKNSLGRLKNES